MRTNIAAGNWKMNTDRDSAAALATGLISGNAYIPARTEVIVAPPAPFLEVVGKAIEEHPKFHLAAQNLHQEEKGAYTGEVSAAMLKSMGCEYVLIGHSERRAYFGEDNTLLFAKVKQALAHGLRPIYCLGESLAQRESGETEAVVGKQLAEGTFGLSAEDFSKLVIAYEPIWAIGTGVTASPAQAQEVHAFLRGKIAAQYGNAVADATSILYGGSVKPANAEELFACPDIDGGLVGGASLKVDAFTEIIWAF